jgi:cell division transport system ATP-binding protein
MHRCDSFPTELSGGEQQRAAIARALVNNPPILIADEPTGNLDPDTSWGIVQILSRINARGTTVVVATHDNQVVDRLIRRVVALDSGKVVRDEDKGTYSSVSDPEELLKSELKES